MKRSSMLVTVAMVVMGMFMVVGCGKKEEDSKGKEEKAEENKGDKKGDKKGTEKKTPARKAKAPAAPVPLPKVDPKGVAKAFPKFVPAGAPPDLAAEIKKIDEVLAKKDWKERRKGTKMLRKLIDANEKNLGLSRYLLSKKDVSTARRGVSMLRKCHEDKDFLPVLISLFGHASDRMRADAISSLGWNLDKAKQAQAAPFVRTLLKDESCIVRREALVRLVQMGGKLGAPKKEIIAALDDKCPVVQAKAMEELKKAIDFKDPDKAIVKKVTEYAQNSPYYYIRCGALKALGKMKIKAAKKLMAKAFDISAGTAVVVYYTHKRSPYTFNLAESTMPACGAAALSDLEGKKFKGSEEERVKAWRKELAKKRLVKKPAKKFCLNKKQCEKDKEICLEQKCVPIAKAEKAYWKHELLKRCMKKPANPPWNNFSKKPAIESGLAFHWMADYAIRKFLKKKNAKAYAKKLEANKKKPCPKK